jgi:exopolysaccharide production protein ExoQ
MARWYYIGSALFILQAMQAYNFIDRLAYGEWSEKGGDKFTLSLNLLLFVTSIALFTRGCRRIGYIQTGAVLAFGLAGFLFLSAAWSVIPQLTIHEAVFYLFVVLAMVGIATNLGGDEFMELVGRMGTLAAATSVILFVVYPTGALSQVGDEFGFRGVFSQKNICVQAMAMGALGCLHGIRLGRDRLRNVCSLILLTIVSLMSKSATSSLAIFMFCMIDMVIFMIRRGGIFRILANIIIVLAIPILIVTIFAPDAFLELIGKDPTLTGRTEIWGFVIPDIFQKPWLGWGYFAFWSLDNPAALQISDTVHWIVPQAHNGVLEILLNVGFIGGAFILYLVVRTFWLSIRCLRGSEREMAISCLLVCVGIIVIGTSETVLMTPFEASTIMFFITGFFCEKALRATRRRPRRYSAYRISVSLEGNMARSTHF